MRRSSAWTRACFCSPCLFDIELKKFTVDYYETGMPKRFASDIIIHDPKQAKPKAFTVEVNHPVTYNGVTIFQSSFEDGGSAVHLKPLFLTSEGDKQAQVVDAEVGGAAVNLPASWLPQDGPLSLEVTGLRVINVEDLAQAQSGNPATNAAKAADVRGVNLAELTKHLG